MMSRYSGKESGGKGIFKHVGSVPCMGSTSVGDSVGPRDVDGGTLEDPDGG